MNKKLSFILSTSIALTVLSTNVAFAGSGGYSTCQIVYGGGEVCPPELSYTLNKLVQKPGSITNTKGGQKTGGEFVENLTINDPKFAPKDSVTYKVVVTNTGKETITNMNVTDTLPAELSFVSGPGKFDANKKTLTFNIDKLDPSKSAEFFIIAKVNENASSENIFCPINRVNAVDSKRNTADDEAMICVTQPSAPVNVEKVPPMKQTPSTGPELFSLAALIPTGALGFYLRRKAK